MDNNQLKMRIAVHSENIEVCNEKLQLDDRMLQGLGETRYYLQADKARSINILSKLRSTLLQRARLTRKN